MTEDSTSLVMRLELLCPTRRPSQPFRIEWLSSIRTARAIRARIYNKRSSSLRLIAGSPFSEWGLPRTLASILNTLCRSNKAVTIFTHRLPPQLIQTRPSPKISSLIHPSSKSGCDRTEIALPRINTREPSIKMIRKPTTIRLQEFLIRVLCVCVVSNVCNRISPDCNL